MAKRSMNTDDSEITEEKVLAAYAAAGVDPDDDSDEALSKLAGEEIVNGMTRAERESVAEYERSGQADRDASYWAALEREETPMNTVTERPEPLKHTFTITIEVDSFWVEYLTGYGSDIFGRQYAGYWLRGVDRHPEREWLCWEDDEQHRKGEEPHRVEALRAWALGEKLPDGWYRLDRAAALRAWEEGVKRWGTSWYEHTDANREDVVVQLALLGEIRYG
jgi:hypothetical protein